MDGRTHYEQQALGLIYGDSFTAPSHLPPHFGSESPLFVLKGILQSLISEISGEKLEYAKARQTALAPERTFALRAAGKLLGVLGELHPLVTEGAEERYAFAQLNLDALADMAERRLQLRRYSVYPRTERDLAVLVPLDIETADVLAVIRKACTELLVDAYPFDIYRGKQIPPDHKSVAFRLTFQSPERTLTGVEVDKLVLDTLVELYRRKNIVIRDFARIKELSVFSDERFTDELKKAYGI